MNKKTESLDPITTDEHAGKGGSYVLGTDGKRVLQERTGPAEPRSTSTESPAAAPSAKTKE